ncbi:hypothetical protein [Salisediminibacterium selenitireducens]|uniref:Uncharacterized protein n=1 Tax=Bacillus selenitireducens (strain ATCC 700615 / DSM 15326 / MLS10) TaxID=439292 RepID=D6XZN8_BACIE|nr:hypothetical protein [Salisediminibacterium selenitireducens]ADH98412.1 hypothetical protein Bsel_0889 [[Bacillus] selenitireducens MLS10]
MNDYLLIVLDSDGNEFTDSSKIHQNVRFQFNFKDFQSAIHEYEVIKSYRNDLSVKIIRR